MCWAGVGFVWLVGLVVGGDTVPSLAVHPTSLPGPVAGLKMPPLGCKIGDILLLSRPKPQLSLELPCRIRRAPER